MASSSSQTSLDHNPWISVRHVFRSLQHPRFPGSFRQKRFSERNTIARDRSVTVPSVWPKSPFQSNDRVPSVLSVSSTQHESSSPSVATNHAVECPVCMQVLPLECFFSFQTCQHRSCLTCLKTFVRLEITEGRIEISCPECPEKLHPADIKAILDDDSLMRKYEGFMLRHVLVLDPDVRWCPAPDCSYAVIATGCASCPQLTCERPGCGTLFCYHCKQRWHPNQTCDSARAERYNIHFPLPSDMNNDHRSQSMIKSCPRCGSLIMKLDDGSCNHMTCAGCTAEFCWLCLKEISDLHYLSPSGCTFWGKKPWSRKRKILWQLGMLIGAPVGISLIAGVSFPVIIIGLPILVGRKLLAKCRHMAKRKRHLVVASGIIASTLVSPVLAAIAVGAGVPMLLAYVYGVVPVSLCRDSCCAGRRPKHAVDLEFDFKNFQDDQKESSTLTSSTVPEGGLPSKTWSSENLSAQNRSLSSRVEVVAEVLCDQSRHLFDDELKENSNISVTKCRNSSLSSADARARVELDAISDARELSRNCLGGASVSDVSLNASPGAYSFSAATVAESTGTHSSSSSSELVHPRLSFHPGKKLFTDGSGSHGASVAAASHVKSFKRQSMSVGDSIDEKVAAERGGYLSLHSLAEEESCLESFAGGSDIVAMVSVSEENSNSDTHGKTRVIRCSNSAAGTLLTEMTDGCATEKCRAADVDIGPTTEKRHSNCRSRVLFAEDYAVQ